VREVLLSAQPIMTARVEKPSNREAVVRNVTRGTTLADRALVADTSEKRRTGLLKHASLPEGEALWIVPSEGVHTFGMKFAIDIVYLSKKKVVVKLRRNMVRRRISFCLRAHSVLELPVGMIDKSQTAVGDQLELIR
jgi:uncharacterized membrane protein (UPF0127 family)